MLTTLRSWLASERARRRPTFRPLLQPLDERVAPATVTEVGSKFSGAAQITASVSGGLSETDSESFSSDDDPEITDAWAVALLDSSLASVTRGGGNFYDSSSQVLAVDVSGQVQGRNTSGSAWSKLTADVLLQKDEFEDDDLAYGVRLSTTGRLHNGVAKLSGTVNGRPFSFEPDSSTNTSKEIIISAPVGSPITLNFETSTSLTTADLAGADVSSYVGVSIDLVAPNETDIAADLFSRLTGGVDYAYSVRYQAVPAATELNFYWAKGPAFGDRIGEPAHSLSIDSGTAVGGYSGFVAFADMTTRPMEATHLVMRVDAADSVVEAVESNNVNAFALPTASITGVTASNDDNPADGRLGPYLPGVKLLNKFTISTDDPDGQIAKVTFSIFNKTWQAQRAGGSKWSLTRDMAQLPDPGADNLVPFTINAFAADSSHLTTHVGLAEVRNKLDFELKGKYLGGTLENVEEFRFLHSVPLKMAFTGTVDGLPSYYKNQVKIALGKETFQPKTVSFADQKLTFAFDREMNRFAAGITQARVYVDSSSLDDKFGDVAENIKVIALPAWLEKNRPSWDGKQGAYTLRSVGLGALVVNAAKLPAVPSWAREWLSSRKTEIGLRPIINLDVPLSLAREVTVSGQEFVSNITVLNDPVHQETIKAVKPIQGTLNKHTLNPENLIIALADNHSLGHKTLFNRKFKYSFTPQTAAFLDLYLTFAFKAIAELKLNSQVHLNFESNKVVFKQEGTFLSLTGSTTFAASVRGSVEILNGWVSPYELISIDANVTLAVTGTVNFSGSLGSVPKPAAGTLKGTLSGGYSLRLLGTGKSKGPVDFLSAADTDPTTDDFTFTLFETSL